MLKDYDVRAESAARTSELSAGAVLVTVGGLSNGVRFTRGGVTIYAETDLFDDDRLRGSAARKRSATAAFLSDLRDLKVGDLIVHVDNGIGEFVGLKQIGVGDSAHEFLELRYHGDDKLFVPVERLDLIQKYTGGSRPALDRLGGTSWAKAKTRVKKAMRDMAEELLKLYAARKAVPGHAFCGRHALAGGVRGRLPVGSDASIRRRAVADIKRDMESSTPMDRLLCGDVGYGKTEVAHARRLQGGDGRQAGGDSRAHDRPRVPAPRRRSRRASRPSRCASTWCRASARKQEQAAIARSSSPAATSTSSSAPTGCCRRTSSSATSACSSSTRSSASAWRTRSASSRCARRWTC